MRKDCLFVRRSRMPKDKVEIQSKAIGPITRAAWVGEYGDAG